MNTIKRKTALIAVGALVVAGGAVGGGVAYARHQTEQRYQAAVQEYDAEVMDLDLSIAVLQANVTMAEKVHKGTENKVADDATRKTLAEEVADAKEALEADYTTEFAHEVDEIHAAIESVGAAQDVVEAAGAELAAAVKAVQDSNVKFLAAKAGDAKTALDGAVAIGEGVLAETEGKVLDNAVRQSLRDALDAAIAVAGEPATEDAAGYEATTKVLADARVIVDDAAQVVRDARDAWQAEQDRLEAERRAAEEQAAREAAAEARRRAAANSGSPKSGSSSSRSSGSGGSGSSGSSGKGSSGGGSSNTGGSSGGGGSGSAGSGNSGGGGSGSSGGGNSGGSSGGNGGGSSGGGNWWDGATPDCTTSSSQTRDPNCRQGLTG